MSRLKKFKFSSGLINSPKSETDDELSSSSNVPERPSQEELELDKTVLPEIEYLRREVADEQLEAIKDVLDRNQDVFSRPKADIGRCYGIGRGRGA